MDKDNRCFKWGKCICHNETRRKGIESKLIDKIRKSGILRSGVTGEDVKMLFEGSEIESIIEYSRSIHAEMEAILSVAREGKHSLVGATLFTNTYPCHNCARHIVASGVWRVIYIEPYRKSLAIALHSDAITEDHDQEGKVLFAQYDGVAPKSYQRLFKPVSARKKLGELQRVAANVAVPVFRVHLDAQADYEAKVVADLAAKEQNPRA